jgi:hypothetical protein
MSRNGEIPKDVYSPYQVVKVLPSKPIRMICQSKEWESIKTHWWGNHSVRCLSPDKCDLCEQRNDVAWKAYLLGTSPTGGVTAIFQLTPLSAFMLEEQITRETGLLGAIIKLTRVGKRRNGPLEASIRGYVNPVEEKPYEQLRRVVGVLYRQYSDLAESG